MHVRAAALLERSDELGVLDTRELLGKQRLSSTSDESAGVNSRQSEATREGGPSGSELGEHLLDVLLLMKLDAAVGEGLALHASLVLRYSTKTKRVCSSTANMAY